MNRRGTILVVDDEPDLREVVEEYPASQGYTMPGAADAAAARQLGSRQPVDRALLEVDLPGAGGLSLARRNREPHRADIVMLTSAGTVMDCIVGLELGGAGTVPKPGTPPDERQGRETNARGTLA